MSSVTTSTSIGLLSGPQLLGGLLNWALQGAFTTQVSFYYSSYPRDPVWMKLLVLAFFAYEWVQTGLITEVLFQNYVYNYGDRLSLVEFHNTWFSVTIMRSIPSSVVQSFYAWRIWVISRNKVLPIFIVVFATFQLCLGITGGVMLRVVNPTAAEASVVTPVICAWLAGAAFVDILVASSMTVLLLRAKRGFQKSNNVINELIRFGVETGIITATAAIVDLVFFTAMPNTLLHECPALVLPKLYSNSLLASLNNRVFLRRKVDGATVVDTIPMTGMGSMVDRCADPPHGGIPGSDHISVQRHVHGVVLEDVEAGGETPSERTFKMDIKSPADALI